MATLISSMSSPAPAPGDDPALRLALARCFVVLHRGIHDEYWRWCKARRRPYVSIETGRGNHVSLCMHTCSWKLSLAQRRHLCELAHQHTRNALEFHYNDDGGTFSFYGVPAAWAETIAFRSYEAADDSRPSGRGEDEECSGR